ncbi:MAG: hypothetical protein BJ554DRAFT_7932 [Olpidium bornovanus]|uniref:Uncharacterized protein n=1 Tax=Olpidium bornovanus TaxID=278681 RepID=A0A8H7ZVB9_9FUNG|nr:MAG: hypothetical protein BJ554DRAFT_7932 [Olpidium bornovanus]
MGAIGPGTRRTGRVKFFNSVKGYGFIIPHHQEPGENIENLGKRDSKRVASHPVESRPGEVLLLLLPVSLMMLLSVPSCFAASTFQFMCLLLSVVAWDRLPVCTICAISRVVAVFVHHTAIRNNGGFKSLAEVEYDLMQGPKGMQASQVTGPAGVSVKGDPNAGKQTNFGHFAGFGGGGAGYMQAYSQPYSGGQPMRQAAQYGMGGQFPAGGPGAGAMYGSSPYGMYNQPPAFGSLYGGNSQGLFGNTTGAPASNQSSPASAGFPGGQGYTAGQQVGSQGAAAGVLGAAPYHNFYGLHANPAGFFYTGAGAGGPGAGQQQQ